MGESYNFGMPRTGDEMFAQKFNELFGDRFFRVTHYMDPVVHLPPNNLIVNWHFTHVSPEIYYKGDVKAGWVQCSNPDDEKCSAQNWNVVTDLLHLANHLDYMDVATSIFDCSFWA